MNKLVGVTAIDRITVNDLKRYLLLFDQLFIAGAKEFLIEIYDRNLDLLARPYLNFVVWKFWSEGMIAQNKDESIQAFCNELNWLIEQGKIVLDERTFFPEQINQDHISIFRKADAISNAALEYTRGIEKESFDYYKFISEMHEFLLRKAAIEMSVGEGIDVYPLIEKFSKVPELETKKQNVYKIIVDKMPLPDDSCPWEKIFDFRSDYDSRGAIAGVRCFANSLNSSNMSIGEIEEKIEYDLYTLERMYKLHKLKTSATIFEVLIIGSAAFAENLIKLKFREVAKGIFSYKNMRIELLESEIKIDGSELAYIVKARDKFLQ